MILLKDKLLNSFFDAFPKEKREKVLKYLAFIGMDYVKTFYSTEENLLGKLKHLASTISQAERKKYRFCKKSIARKFSQAF